MQVRGATGELRWAYLPACHFGPWRLHTQPGSATLEADVVSADDYRMQQGPLLARLYIGRQTLTYAVEDVTLTGARLSARLGAQQKGQR
jgi:hypothetical protein